MSDAFAAIGTGVLILTPIVILTIVVSMAAGKRGEDNLHSGDH